MVKGCLKLFWYFLKVVSYCTKIRMDKITDILRISTLIAKQRSFGLSEQEQIELGDWLDRDVANRRLYDELKNESNLESELSKFRRYDANAAFKRVMTRIAESEDVAASSHINWRMALKIAASILIFLSVGLGLYYYQHSVKTQKNLQAYTKRAHELLPGTHAAVLIMANGTRVGLTDHSDTSFNNGGSNIRASGGHLSYGSQSIPGAADTNTLVTNTGQAYNLILADGTRVWLNAGSSLKYPTRFGRKERTVFMTGEAFFAVAHQASAPFKVIVNGRQIRDIGTEFNVNAYNDSPTVNAALVSGSIEVYTKGEHQIIKPGQLANIAERKILVVPADLKSITAWKNDLFIFHQAPLTKIMKIIARWYGAKVIYSPDFIGDDVFTGEMSRDIPVSKLLERIEKTGLARFSINSSTIVVHPYKENKTNFSTN